MQVVSHEENCIYCRHSGNKTKPTTMSVYVPVQDLDFQRHIFSTYGIQCQWFEVIGDPIGGIVKNHGLNFLCVSLSHSDTRGRSDRDRMVVGFITTYEISAYHDSICEFEPLSWRGVIDTTLCDKVCQWVAAGRCYSPGTPISFIKKNWPPRYNWNIDTFSII